MIKKKILVLGGDGYLGWPVAMKLSRAGHDVTICDNFNKRKWGLEIGVKPLLQIPILQDRVKKWEKAIGNPIKLAIGDLTNQRFVYDLFESKPDIVVHGADQPSAPFSMKGINTAVATQTNNVVAGLNILFAIKRSCPQCLYIRLGASSLAMADVESSRELFASDSFYELSRLHDFNNMFFSCKNWGLRVVQVNTGVVYNINTDETLLQDSFKTAFHYDRVFGTLINRFCVESVMGIPLTVYGDGAHKCGFTTLQKAVDSVTDVIYADDQIKPGDIRIKNVFQSIVSVNEAAGKVGQAAKELGFETSIEYIDNPRKEFSAARGSLFSESMIIQTEPLDVDILKELIKKIVENKNSVLVDSIQPVIKWLNN